MEEILDYSNLEGFIFLDGKLLKWTDAKLHVLSHGLHYASSVFEGERAYGGKIYGSGCVGFMIDYFP